MSVDVSSIWRFVSNFFNFLSQEDRERYENIWEGQALIAQELDQKAGRFVLSQSPETSSIDPEINYYDVVIDVLKARPIQLDPTSLDSRYIMIPKRKIETQPVPSGRDSVRNDHIEIGSQDYADIRDVAIGSYCVISADEIDIPTKYFTVLNTKGPSEADPLKYNDLYVIELDGGNLSYIPEDARFSIYLTTARVYKVDDFIIDIPTLSTNIQDFDSDGNVVGTVLVKDQDFTFENATIELQEDFIASGQITDGDTVYAKNIPVMENNLFAIYGTLVGISDWRKFKYDNISGKAAINGLVKSLQNPSKRENYERALNIYYGLPIAPTDLTVVGLYESYGYTITAIDTNTVEVTLDLKVSSSLHPFVQPGSKFMVDGKNFEVNIPYDATESNVINRTTGVVTLASVSGLVVGDDLNVRLANKKRFTKITKPVFTDSVFTTSHWTAGGEFQHLSDTVYGIGQTSGFTRYPQIVIYNSDDEGSGKNFDGLYHYKTVQMETGATFPAPTYTDNIEFTIDDRISSVEEPVYNDYIDLDDGDVYEVGVGYFHTPWPTHKYLLVTLEDGSYYKLYIDSAIDTLLDEGDKMSKYDVLCRSLSSLSQNIFPYWNEFNGFRVSSGIDLESNMLELINVIPHTKFGTYFPDPV